MFTYKDENGQSTGFQQAGGKGHFFQWIEDIVEVPIPETDPVETETKHVIMVQHEGSNVFFGYLEDLTVNGNSVTFAELAATL